MSNKDYNEIEKTICGKWKSDRDENMDAWVAASGQNTFCVKWCGFAIKLMSSAGYLCENF